MYKKSLVYIVCTTLRTPLFLLAGPELPDPAGAGAVRLRILRDMEPGHCAGPGQPGRQLSEQPGPPARPACPQQHLLYRPDCPPAGGVWRGRYRVRTPGVRFVRLKYYALHAELGKMTS